MTTEHEADAGRKITPAVIAAELGVDQYDIRKYLRKNFPRPDEANGDYWYLTKEQVTALREHFAGQRAATGAPLAYVRENRISKAAEDAAWTFLRAGLLQEDSPLTGGRSVWTADNARDVVHRILESPLAGSEMSFDEKIRIQLHGADADVIQLIAEMQVVRQIVTGGIRLPGATKALAMYSELADESWAMPEWLALAFSEHVFGGGNFFNQGQWLHLTLTARFVESWFAADGAERQRLFTNPWALLDFLETVGGDDAAEKHMRMVLAYVAWPNYFHPIISSAHIKKIRSGYREFLPEPGGQSNAEIQRDLYAIQCGLEQRFGGAVNFYESPYKEAWQSEVQPEPPVVTPIDVPALGFDDRAAELAAKVHMDPAALRRIGRVLETRRQVVFYGPPGTGKTFIARKLAAKLAGNEFPAAVRLVQFHPSYSYEDFFEGFRPSAADGGTGFTLQSGPLRKLAASAKDNPDQPHFLIIDEMNRGNLAKVFGELYFLLEYRDQEVYLQYSPQVAFTLPENLYVIGTMNTTDRSIGLVDAAIRRRFAFIEFHPEVSPVEGVLERYLEAEGHPSELALLLSRLNARIGDRDLRVGPSYLMRPQALEAQGLEDIWEYDILPLLYEQFHGHKDAAAVRREFSLEAMRNTATPPRE